MSQILVSQEEVKVICLSLLKIFLLTLVRHLLKEFNDRITYNPAISSLGIYTKEMKSLS